MNLGHPYFLFLLIPFILVFVSALRKKQPSLVIGSKKNFPIKNIQRKINRTHIPLFFYFFSIIGVIIALVRPQKGLEIIENKQFVLDIIFALDVSGSMKIFDAKEGLEGREVVKQINSKKLIPRIDVAKRELLRFVDQRPNDRLGLIVFAEKAFSSCPPTLEHDYLREKIKELSVRTLGDFSSATGIAGPIKSTINKLKSSPAKRRVMILFTDGENTVKDDITPEQAADIAKEYNISIYTVGIGSNNSYAISNSFLGRKNLVKQKANFNEKLLKDIAQKTKGKYFLADNQEAFQRAIDEINKLEKVEVKNESFTHYKEYYYYFILFSLLVSSLGFLLQMTLFRRLP